MSDVETLAMNEPWRVGMGQPRNALDPTWLGTEPPACTGDIAFEHTTKWWICTSCGHCSNLSYVVHYPAQSPVHYFTESLCYFIAKRREQEASTELITSQALWVAGVALRYAATFKPGKIRNYVWRLIAR